MGANLLAILAKSAFQVMLRSKSFDSFRRLVRGKKGRDKVNEDEAEEDGEQVDEVDEELRELEDRVKQWLKQSQPPPSTSAVTDDALQTNKKEDSAKRSEKRRHSMQEVRTRPPREGETILYHPDFAEWTSCEPDYKDIVSPKKNNSPPVILDILDGAHTSISKLFNF